MLYRTVNGGAPARPVFSERDRLITFYLGVMDQESMKTTAREYDIGRLVGILGDRILIDDEYEVPLVPFAEVFGGDYLCLDYRKTADQPSVVLWQHEESMALSPATVEVAPSLDDFLAGCRPNERDLEGDR